MFGEIKQIEFLMQGEFNFCKSNQSQNPEGFIKKGLNGRPHSQFRAHTDCFH
jgi:hypothetical protein